MFAYIQTNSIQNLENMIAPNKTFKKAWVKYTAEDVHGIQSKTCFALWSWFEEASLVALLTENTWNFEKQGLHAKATGDWKDDYQKTFKTPSRQAAVKKGNVSAPGDRDLNIIHPEPTSSPPNHPSLSQLLTSQTQ